MVYISEYENHRISIFTSMGQFVMSFGKKGEGPGEFLHPYGVAVGGCGEVYVADSVFRFFSFLFKIVVPTSCTINYILYNFPIFV